MENQSVKSSDTTVSDVSQRATGPPSLPEDHETRLLDGTKDDDMARWFGEDSEWGPWFLTP